MVTITEHGRSVHYPRRSSNRSVSKKRSSSLRRFAGRVSAPVRSLYDRAAWLASQGARLVGGKPLQKVLKDTLKWKGGYSGVKRSIRDYDKAHPKTRAQGVFDAIGNAEKKVLNAIGFGSPPRKRQRSSGGGNVPISGPSTPKSITSGNVPPKRPQSNMRGKRRIKYGGANSISKFQVKKRQKIGPVLQKGACLKGETQVTVTDSECVYFGHNSHPLRPTLRAIGLSIVRLLMRSWRQDVPDFQSYINGDNPTPGSSVTCAIVYRIAYDGLPLESTFDSNNSTWVMLADNIMHRICLLCSSSLTYFELLSIRFRNSSTTILATNQSVTYDCKKLRIRVAGKSTMKVQNVTVGQSGEAIADASADDVAANPLQGKMYTGNGQYHTYLFTQDQTLTAPIIRYDPDNGDTQFTPSTADLSTAQARVLKKPPPYRAFTHMNGAGKVLLKPGEIKSNTCKTVYELNFNQWITKMMNVLRTGVSLAAVSNAGMCNLGTNAIFGLEHAVKAPSGDADVAVHYQADWTVSAIASHKKEPYCNPVYDVAVSSIIV